MRFRVEVPDEDEGPLRTLAVRDNVRGFKEYAGYLLHLKVQEELARLLDSQPDTDAVAEVA
jgi:hypothetical protein